LAHNDFYQYSHQGVCGSERYCLGLYSICLFGGVGVRDGNRSFHTSYYRSRIVAKYSDNFFKIRYFNLLGKKFRKQVSE
jgi:hypothetical protein